MEEGEEKGGVEEGEEKGGVEEGEEKGRYVTENGFFDVAG